MAEFPRLRQEVIQDLREIGVFSQSRFKLIGYFLWALIYAPGFACAFFYRLNHYLYRRRWRGARILNVWRFYHFACDISYKTQIGGGLKLVHVIGTVIGKRAKIGENVTILNGVSIGSKGFGDNHMPTIGNRVFIGAGAKILGGITIGEGSVIGALTFCNQSVPPHCLAVGNPMKVIPLSDLKKA